MLTIVTVEAITAAVTEAGLTACAEDGTVYVPLGGGRGVILAPSEDGGMVTLDHVGAGWDPSPWGQHDILDLADVGARVRQAAVPHLTEALRLAAARRVADREGVVDLGNTAHPVSDRVLLDILEAADRAVRD